MPRVKRETSPRVDQLYLEYLARYRALRTAVQRCDAEALRRAELELRSLSSVDQHIAALAIHDIAMKLPLRAKVHFVRAIRGAAAADRAAPVRRRCRRRRAPA